MGKYFSRGGSHYIRFPFMIKFQINDLYNFERAQGVLSGGNLNNLKSQFLGLPQRGSSGTGVRKGSLRHFSRSLKKFWSGLLRLLSGISGRTEKL